MLALLLAGCATQPKVVHLTWVKDDATAGQVQRNGSDCVIVTRTAAVSYSEFGDLFRKCL